MKKAGGETPLNPCGTDERHLMAFDTSGRIIAYPKYIIAYITNNVKEKP